MHQQDRRNKWLAALMGLAMPGLGNYNGELIKGMSYFVIL